MAATVEARQAGGASANARWNFLTFGSDIAFFSLALSISSAYVVLPLFVHHLTPNNTAVALIAAVRALGLYAPQLIVAPLVERQRQTMPFILRWTIIERAPYLVLAVATLLLARSHPEWLLVLFFLMILTALTGSGLCSPAWLDVIARTMPKNWLGRFLGFWTGVGGFLGIGGAAVAAYLLAHMAWPLNFALCFLLTFSAMVVSFVLLALGREPARDLRDAQPTIADAEAEAEESLTGREVAEAEAAREGPAGVVVAPISPFTRLQTHFQAQMREILQLLREDSGLPRLLASNGLASFAAMAGILFAVSALKLGGLSNAEAGAEAAVLAIASTVGNFLWGSVGDVRGHKLVMTLGSACAGVAALFALGARGFFPYALIFLLMGLNLAATNLASYTLIAEFGPEHRRPTYIALASVAYAPFAVGTPLLAGWLADAWGYRPVFILSALAGAVATICFIYWVPDPRRRPTGD